MALLKKAVNWSACGTDLGYIAEESGFGPTRAGRARRRKGGTKLRASSLVGTATSVLAIVCTVAVAGPAIAASNPGPTAAQARAEAAKINLVGSDLPGWAPSPNVNSKSDDAASNQLALCSGAQDPPKIDVVDVNSPYFDQGNAEVTSGVTVVRDRSDALQDLAGMKGKKLLPCLQKILVPYLKTRNCRRKRDDVGVQDRRLGSLLAAVRTPFGYRLTEAISAKAASGATVTEELVSDQYGFLVGQTEVGLSSSQFSPGAVVVPCACDGEATDRSARAPGPTSTRSPVTPSDLPRRLPGAVSRPYPSHWRKGLN